MSKNLYCNVKTIHILSDCQSAILSSSNSKIADGYQEDINEINKAAKIFFEKGIKTLISWIGGHNDVEGNNIADNAARNGALSTADIPDEKITLKTAKKIITDSAM